MSRQTVLFKLLSAYAGNPEMVKSISALLQNETSYDKHQDLATLIKVRGLKGELIDEYKVKYHEYLYEVQGSFKVWRNDNGVEHCDLKDENGMTLPSSTGEGEYKEWRINGQLCRTDRDADGYLLPSHIAKNGDPSWMTGPQFHRAELGKDNKALHAKVRNGVKSYHYKGREMTQKKLTKKLLKKSFKRRAITGQFLTITMKNGDKFNFYDVVDCQWTNLPLAVCGEAANSSSATVCGSATNSQTNAPN